MIVLWSIYFAAGGLTSSVLTATLINFISQRRLERYMRRKAAVLDADIARLQDDIRKGRAL